LRKIHDFTDDRRHCRHCRQEPRMIRKLPDVLSPAELVTICALVLSFESLLSNAHYCKRTSHLSSQMPAFRVEGFAVRAPPAISRSLSGFALVRDDISCFRSEILNRIQQSDE
jgi:hypothetical protein